MNKTGILSLGLFMAVVAITPAKAQNDNALCKLRAQHVVTDDVAYRAGVDVQGKAVVPADLTYAPSVVPDVIRIPLTVDVAEKIGIQQAGVEMKSELGMIEIHRNGHVTYNGQDYSAQTAVVCGDPENLPATTVVPETSEKPLQLPTVAPAAEVPEVLGAAAPEEPVTPTKSAEQQDKKEEIIWGEGY
ncbi:MAG: hypothetical protein ACK4NR_08160 [Micavibrio sp.]